MVQISRALMARKCFRRNGTPGCRTKVNMRLLPILAVIGLVGCASPTNPAHTAFQAYVDQQRPRAQAGEVKWSEYYGGLYELAERAGAPGAVLGDINKFAGLAIQYESGSLTKDEHTLRERELKAIITERQQLEQEYESARRQSLGAAQFAAGMAMMQGSQPQYIAPQTSYPPRPAGNAYVTGYLRSNTVNGSIKYCNYSNGAVVSVASHQICPSSTR